MACFIISPGIPVPKALPHALELAEQLLRSDKFLKEFLMLVPDASKASVIAVVNAGEIVVDTIRSWSQMKAYATTCLDPKRIAFNPILLAEMVKREATSGGSAGECEQQPSGEAPAAKWQRTHYLTSEQHFKHVYFLFVKTLGMFCFPAR
jgi:hypothetical protein